MIMTELVKRASPDEIAAGYLPERTTSVAGTDINLPPLQIASLQLNTERLATLGSGTTRIFMLSGCLAVGGGQFGVPAAEWHISATDFNLVRAACSFAGKHAFASEAQKEQDFHEHLLTAPVGAQASEALAALGATKGQLAEILGIERPHLYAWLANKVAQPAKGERLRNLLRALRKAGITNEAPIRGHLLREPLELGGDSLLKILRSEELDSATVASQLATACRLTRSIQDQAASHLARMRAAGHTSPSADEAQAALDTALTLLEWDDV